MKIHSLFPTPVYETNLNREFTKQELELIKASEIECIPNMGNTSSEDNYILEQEGFKDLKKELEIILKDYMDKVVSPNQKTDCYITQSWLNITKPGEMHHEHIHQNSIVSGVFYIQAEEDDKITFVDPMAPRKNMICFEKENFNIWNSDTWFFPANPGELLLFPSWLTHKVAVNENATTDRISLSFNTFAKGVLGSKYNSSELILG